MDSYDTLVMGYSQLGLSENMGFSPQNYRHFFLGMMIIISLYPLGLRSGYD